MTEIVQYTGALAPDVLIATDTEPWLEDPTGTPVDLTAFAPASPRTTGPSACDCDTWAILPGILAPWGDQHGIERHDDCARYPSDLEAAAVLAAHLEQVTGTPYTVHFERAEIPPPEGLTLVNLSGSVIPVRSTPTPGGTP